MHLYVLEVTEPQILPPQHPEELPEEDQVFFLLMISKKMYQLAKFLICLTYLQSKKGNQLKKKKTYANNLFSYLQFQFQP